MDEQPLYTRGSGFINQETGKTLDEWKAIIDKWGGLGKGHTETVKHLKEKYDLSDEWAHAITVRCQMDEYMGDRKKVS